MLSDLRSDMFRYLGPTPTVRARFILLFNQGFAAVLCYRLGRGLSRSRLPWGLRQLIGAVYFIYWKTVETATGITLPADCEIGPGLYIGHFGQIIVNSSVTMGRNCNLSQGVTLGLAPRGDRVGSPRLGDAIYMAPGAKIIGPIYLADGTAVGANAVVTRDTKPGDVVVGIPAKPVNQEGSSRYIQNPVPNEGISPESDGS